MITRQAVTEKLLAYLNGAITLSELVDWAENCFVSGGFAPDEDIDLLADIVMYLAGADRPISRSCGKPSPISSIGSALKVVPI